MPDLLDLNKTITTVDNATLPEAAQLANSVIANAATLLNGAINNGAVLLAQLLGGVEVERVQATNGLTTAIAPLLEESKAWRGEISRLCDILERISLTPPKAKS